MTRSALLLIILFVITLLGGLAAFAPLSFALRQSGMVERGLGWQQARGSIWHGQVTGLTWRGQALGAVNLDSNPLRMLTGGASHAVNWTGPYGQGQAHIKASRSSLLAEGISLSLPLTERIGMDPALAHLGATLRLSNGLVRLDGAQCREASGTVTSDAARRVAVEFGRDWPLLSGPLACEAGHLQAALSGDAADGTRIRLTASQDTGFRIELANTDDDLKNMLLSGGFRNEEGVLVYDRALEGVETTP